MIRDVELQENTLVHSVEELQELLESNQTAHRMGLGAAGVATAAATLLIMTHPVYVANALESGIDVAAEGLNEGIAYFMVNLPALSITGLTSLATTGFAVFGGDEVLSRFDSEGEDFRLDEQDPGVQNFLTSPLCNESVPCSTMPPQAGSK
jgi:hypothetical protein